MRFSVLRACLGGVCIAACSDTSRPPAAAGHYALASVNGQPMPFVSPPSGGFYYAPLTIGDLVLRADGTYGLGLTWFFEGTWTLDGTRLHLAQFMAQGPNGTDAEAQGDSVVIDVPGSGGNGTVYGTSPPMHYVFRRSTAAAPVVTSGTFALTSINGRGEPLMLVDTVVNGMRFVDRVLYDSVTFTDGVFFRKRRAEEYASNGVGGYESYDTFGSYRGRPDSLVLTYYRPPSSGMSATDRLAVEQQALVRRTAFTTGIRVERYTRR